MTISLNVAIVGAGPGGLGLANILYQISKSLPNPTHLSFKVFELDPSKDFRPQGGMLDIHRSSGQQALKRGGVIEAFKKHMRIDATELFIRDNHGVAHLRHSEDEEGGLGEEGEVSNIERPEIDRWTLRSILIEGLPEQSVEWAKKLVSITKSESSRASGSQFELHFADGSSAKGFDLVIGADGTWSKVRSGTEALTGVKPSIPPYSGLICIDTLISDAQKRHPELVKFNGKGSCFAVSRNTSLASQLNGDGSLRVYYFFNAKEDWKVEGQPGKRRADRLIPKGPFVDECLSEWCQTSKELVIQSDTDELVVRPLYEYPPGYSWKSPIPGITLLGDAAHVMTPFSGIGVNLALADALDLSTAIEEIIAGSKPVGEALDTFEAKMYKRSSEGCAQTYYNRTLFMGKPGPDGTIMENEGVEKVVEIFTRQAYTKPEFD